MSRDIVSLQNPVGPRRSSALPNITQLEVYSGLDQAPAARLSNNLLSSLGVDAANLVPRSAFATFMPLGHEMGEIMAGP
ncbi:uncharacterized protein N7482_004159 [Penicillium canariense]|uniref:Uncharacterized protein n=1 Tax=Penicillium canariense TaxID=189055 RepID=A0A9W9LQ05_9EURO|nr:uncharacterized protein N7482_004159 [Penicillium canariense]KAJ5168565.1 hypothetical protein N7482_004159 [Penicillium canariense]